MKNLLIICYALFLFLGCSSISNPYPWIKNQTLDQILKDSKDKLILIDFETEW